MGPYVGLARLGWLKIVHSQHTGRPAIGSPVAQTPKLAASSSQHTGTHTDSGASKAEGVAAMLSLAANRKSHESGKVDRGAAPRQWRSESFETEVSQGDCGYAGELLAHDTRCLGGPPRSPSAP